MKKMEMCTDVPSINKEIDTLKCQHQKLRKEIESLKIEKQEILAELGQILFEKTAKESEGRKSDLFQRIFRSSSPEVKRFAVSIITVSSEQPAQGAEALQGGNHQPGKQETVTRDKDESKIQRGDQNSTGISTYRSNSENQNPTTQNSSSIASREKTSGGEGIDTWTSDAASTSRDENNTLQSYEHLSFSVQQDVSNGREYISLGSVPPTSVATTLYNNYKLLLLSLCQSLLSSDVVKLKDWASQNFSIENTQNVINVLLQLDQKGIINASHLSPLRDFFESIIRIDLVYIIDAFLYGDYSLLRQISALKTRDANRAQNPQYGCTSRFSSLLNTLSTSQSWVSSQMSTNRNPATSRKPQNSNGPQSSVAQQNHRLVLPSFLGYTNTNNANLVSRSPNENQSKAHKQRNVKPIASGFTETSVVVADGPVTNERRMTRKSSTTNPPVTRRTIGSNGSKLSRFQDTERSIVSFAQAPSRNQDLNFESNWLCSHYKRLCFVKFECCDNFWPCHRCHNNQSTCGRKKLKSRDTQMVQCVYCNKAQQFGQFCCDCGAKFASYFCGLCQHLTGNDDHPYHCQKCGICRIQKDRSFHCEICDVCLDVKFRGNHKCGDVSTAITYSPSPVNINQGASSYCDTQTFDNGSLQSSAVTQKPENINGPQSSGIGWPNDHQNGHRFHVNANASTSDGSTNSFPKPQTSNESTNPSTLNATARGEQSVQGAVSLVQRTNHQPGKKQTVTRDKDESEFRGYQEGTTISNNTNDSETQNPMQNSCNTTNNLQNVRQSDEDLSFSVRQDDSNGREFISLGQQLQGPANDFECFLPGIPQSLDDEEEHRLTVSGVPQSLDGS